MLPEQEYEKAKWQLANFPDEIKGEKRNRLRQELKKKIKEYEYGTTLPPFESMPHIPFFINRTTTEPALNQLIQAVTTSTEFIIDTESISIHKQRNKPVLIQLQVLLPHHLSLVLIIEMYHLPKKQHPHFELIKNLFQIVFSQDKKIFIWGPKDELYPFITFDVFTQQQIDDTNIVNLQSKFKEFWNQQHPCHKRSSKITNTKCRCEQCLGKELSHIWSLQDGTAHEIGEYLSKQLTNEDFHIGLDSNLYPMNSDELNYRHKLIEYAINDCIAMQRILIKMKQKNFYFEEKKEKKSITFNLFELSSVSSDDEQEEIFIEPMGTNQSKYKLNSTSTQSNTSTKTRSKIINWKPQSTNGNSLSTTTTNNSTTYTNRPSTYEHEREQLTEQQRKKIHNRTCTLKQRCRSYQHELIFRDIDRRFPIRTIKQILRENHIQFQPSAVNTTTNNLNKTSLFVGIKDRTLLQEYEEKTKHFFTTQHYQQWCRNNRTKTSSNHRDYNDNQHRRK